jgi:hypothetical protein
VPDRVMRDYWAVPEIDARLRQHYGVESQDELLDTLDIDFRDIEGPAYIGPPLATHGDGSDDDLEDILEPAGDHLPLAGDEPKEDCQKNRHDEDHHHVIGDAIGRVLDLEPDQGEERGDRHTELADLPLFFVVLAIPSFPVPTPQVYGALLPSSLTSPGEESKISRFLETRDLGFLENRLEDTIFRLYPQLVEYKSLFRNHGAELSLVTGSGSAVYGLFRDRGRAERCLADARKRGEAVLTETVTRLQGWNELEAGVSPSGKAADFGSAIRGFESSRPSFDISNDETKD